MKYCCSWQCLSVCPDLFLMCLLENGSDRALMRLLVHLLMIPSSLEKLLFNTTSTNVNAVCKSSEVRVCRPSRTKQ